MSQEFEKNEIDKLRSLRDEVHYVKENEWPHYIEGSLLESVVVEIAGDLQVAREMAITSALGAMAVACQGLIDVKQPTGNKVNTGLMLLTIAESGERKTTVEKFFFKMIREQQKSVLQDYIKTDSDHRIKKGIDKEKESALIKQIKQLTEKGEDAKAVEQKLFELKSSQQPQPIAKRFLYEDTTPQALTQGMNEGCKNACIVSSEANGMFNGKIFTELHLLNTLWDGGDVTVDRVTKQSFIVTNARLTLALMTQMSVIERFLDNRGEEARGMGFLARFLVVRPKAKAGYRDMRKKISDLEQVNLFNHRIGEILTSSLENEGKNITRDTITFNATSAKLWQDLSQQIEEEMRVHGVYEHYTDHASKLMDNITRVAGIIEYFEGKNEEISSKTLLFSYSLCMRYSKHFLSYLAGEPAVVTNANLLAQFLLDECRKDSSNSNDQFTPFEYKGEYVRKGKSCCFSLTHLMQRGPNKLRNSKNDYALLNNAIELLQRMGFIGKSKFRDKEYRFCESLVYEHKHFSGFSNETYDRLKEPMLKNGNEFTIVALPLWDELVAYQPVENNSLTIIYECDILSYYIKVA